MARWSRSFHQPEALNTQRQATSILRCLDTWKYLVCEDFGYMKIFVHKIRTPAVIKPIRLNCSFPASWLNSKASQVSGPRRIATGRPEPITRARSQIPPTSHALVRPSESEYETRGKVERQSVFPWDYDDYRVVEYLLPRRSRSSSETTVKESSSRVQYRELSEMKHLW